MQVRQGDVMVEKIEAMDLDTKDMKKIARDKFGRVCLAEGEATDHSHCILDKEGVDLYEDSEGTLWLVTDHDTELRHVNPDDTLTGEHATVPVKKGVNRVILQREYDWEKEWRRVAD